MSGIAMYYISKKFTKKPLFATLFLVTSVAFAVNSTNIMYDIPLLAFLLLALSFVSAAYPHTYRTTMNSPYYADYSQMTAMRNGCNYMETTYYYSPYPQKVVPCSSCQREINRYIPEMVPEIVYNQVSVPSCKTCSHPSAYPYYAMGY